MFWDREQGKLFFAGVSARHVSAHLFTVVTDEKLAERVAELLHMEDKGLSNTQRWWRFDTVLKLYVPNTKDIHPLEAYVATWKVPYEVLGSPNPSKYGFQGSDGQMHYFWESSNFVHLKEMIRETAIRIHHRNSEELWFSLK